MFKVKNDTSKALSVDWTDVQKLTRDALMVGGAAGAAYFISHLSGVNMGEYTAFIVPFLALIANLGYKWFKDNGPEEGENV